MSELSLRSRIRSKVSRIHLNLRQLYLYLVLIFTFVFKLFHTILRIIGELHGIYKPFIWNIFFSNCQIICPGGKIIYTFNNLVCGTTERNEVSKRKHWELNIAIKCIYFFFCIWQSTPALLLLSLLRLVWLNFACHFPGRFHRIFSLSRCRKRKRFFMRLKEFVVHFKTGKNLWLTLKNVFVCFWLFKRW